jgi:hypothetical protein
MTTYRVTWEIDIEADNPTDAAREARKIQRDLESTATVFAVSETFSPGMTKISIVDLAERTPK